MSLNFNKDLNKKNETHSLKENIIKVFLKFHILFQNSKWEISVQKIKLKKIIF